jgi:hypothetical protein
MTDGLDFDALVLVVIAGSLVDDAPESVHESLGDMAIINVRVCQSGTVGASRLSLIAG